MREPNWSSQLSAKCLNSNIPRAGWNWLPLLFQVIMNSRLSNKAAHTTLQGSRRCHFQCGVELAWSQPRSHATLIVRCRSPWEAKVSNSSTWLCGAKQVTESAGQNSCRGGMTKKKKREAASGSLCLAKQMPESGFRQKLSLLVSIWTHNSTLLILFVLIFVLYIQIEGGICPPPTTRPPPPRLGQRIRGGNRRQRLWFCMLQGLSKLW